MLIAWFGSYSYARTWDLSWGNRPASEMDAISAQKKEKVMKKFKSSSRKLILGLICMNVLLFIVPLQGQLYLMSIFFVLSAYQLALSIIFCSINIIVKLAFIFKKCSISCSNKNIQENDVSDMV